MDRLCAGAGIPAWLSGSMLVTPPADGSDVLAGIYGAEQAVCWVCEAVRGSVAGNAEEGSS